MKVALLDVRGEPFKRKAVYKDFSNGFGTAFWIGDSLRAKFIEFSKRHLLEFPSPMMGYAAAQLGEAGHSVQYVENQVVEADLVIIKSSIVDYKAELAFAQRYREETGAKVGFIGAFSGQMPELFLKKSDFVVKGEPESALMKIAKGKIPKGLVKSPPVVNLDKLPFPDWSIFPVERYRYGPSLKEKPVLPMLSSRGCLYKCSYCPYVVGVPWRKRNPVSVVDEIQCNVDHYGVKGVLFRDPLFGANKEHAKVIASEMISRKFSLPWVCETRLDLLDNKTLDLFCRAGLKSVNVGIESPNVGLLKAAGRKSIEEGHQRRVIRHCNDRGIKVTAFFILGLPNDTVESVEQTIEYAKSLDVNVASFRICTPYPGTKFFESVKDRIYAGWQDFDTYTPVFRHENISRKQLLRLKEKAFVEFYFRPGFILNFFRRNLL